MPNPFFQHLKNQFEGTCIVLGSGPSQLLLPRDTHVFCITANYACNYIHNSLGFYQDKGFYQDQSILTRYQHHRLLSIYSADQKHMFTQIPGFTIHKHYGDNQGKRYLDDLVCPTIFSGFQACLAARLMGFNTILAVGMDAQPATPYIYAIPHPSKGKRNNKIEAHQGLIRNNYEAFQTFAQRYNIVNCTSANWAKKHTILEQLKTVPDNKISTIKKIEDIYLSTCDAEDKRQYLAKKRMP